MKKMKMSGCDGKVVKTLLVLVPKRSHSGAKGLGSYSHVLVAELLLYCFCITVAIFADEQKGKQHASGTSLVAVKT